MYLYILKTISTFISYIELSGFWLGHCHMEIHNAAGMSFIIQEGEPSEMPRPPHGMPTCGDFKYDGVEYNAIKSDKYNLIGNFHFKL